MDRLIELAERLEKRAKEDRAAADNSFLVAQLLEPELAKFESREGPWNTYAVRMAVDHRNSGKRDAAFADDLEQAAAALRSKSTPDILRSEK